jgi:hypothetical protein
VFVIVYAQPCTRTIWLSHDALSLQSSFGQKPTWLAPSQQAWFAGPQQAIKQAFAAPELLGPYSNHAPLQLTC